MNFFLNPAEEPFFNSRCPPAAQSDGRRTLVLWYQSEQTPGGCIATENLDTKTDYTNPVPSTINKSRINKLFGHKKSLPLREGLICF